MIWESWEQKYSCTLYQTGYEDLTALAPGEKSLQKEFDELETCLDMTEKIEKCVPWLSELS